jgi:hypothetical protein
VRRPPSYELSNFQFVEYTKYIHKYTHAYKHTCMHTYMHTHTHTQTGPLCGVCRSPGYELSNFQCVECSAETGSLVIVLVIGIPLVALILYVASWRPMFLDPDSNTDELSDDPLAMRTADPFPIRSAILRLLRRCCSGWRLPYFDRSPVREDPKSTEPVPGRQPKSTIVVKLFMFLRTVWSRNSLGIALKVLCVCLYVFECVCACVFVCLCACLCVFARACGSLPSSSSSTNSWHHGSHSSHTYSHTHIRTRAHTQIIIVVIYRFMASWFT